MIENPGSLITGIQSFGLSTEGESGGDVGVEGKFLPSGLAWGSMIVD